MLFRDIKLFARVSLTEPRFLSQSYVRFAHHDATLTALKLERLFRFTDFLTLVGKLRDRDLTEITRPTHAEPEPKVFVLRGDSLIWALN